MLSLPLRSPLVAAVPLLRRLRFAAGAEVGMSNGTPLVEFSRPCLRVLGEILDLPAASSPLTSSLGDEVARIEFGPKKKVDDGDDRVP